MTASATAAPATSVHAVGKNIWTATLATTCGPRIWKLEALETGLFRLTLQGEEREQPGAQLHISGGGPYFGLGERFWQDVL